MNIQEIRQKYPGYNDLSDTELAQKLHSKFYADMPFEQFSSKVGLKQTQDPRPIDASQIPNIRDISPEDFAAQQAGVPSQRVAPIAPSSEAQAFMDKPFYERVFSRPPEEMRISADQITNTLGRNQMSPQDQAMMMATIGSLAAPQVVIPATLARTLGPGLTAVLSQVGRIPAAGLGGFTGRVIGEQQQNPQQGLLDTLAKGGQSGAEAAIFETGGTMAAPMIAKAMAPFAGSMDDVSKAMKSYAESKGIPLSPSAYKPSLVAKGFENTLDEFLPSRIVDDAYRKKAIVRFNQLASKEIPELVTKVKPSNIVNEAAQKEFGRILKESESKAIGGANKFLSEIGAETPVNVAKTEDLLKKIVADAQDESLKKFATDKLKRIGDASSISADSLETMLRQVGKINPKQDTKFLEKLRGVIKEDFQRAGGNMELLQESNEAFKEMLGALKGKHAKSMMAATKKGDAIPSITRDIFRSDNLPLVNFVKKNMSPEVFDDLLTENLSLMLKDSALTGPKGATMLKKSARLPGQLIYDGEKLKTIIQRNMPILKEAYDPKVISALNNFAELNSYAAKDIAKFEQGLDKTMQGFQGAGLIGSFIHSPVATTTGTAGSALIAKTLMNPKGILNNWLTTGLSPSAQRFTNEALRIGGRPVFMGSEEDGQD
ncbi:MAG: hypothetical protein PHE50_00195 [Dehalococcoidales bacterium]|nr:hypothetical protein [Dehalococcoidales bacterium]